MQICDQCGLPFSGRGIETSRNDSTLRFCCYGCSFTYSLLGQEGKRGTAGYFLLRLAFSAFLSMNIMALSWALYDPGWIALGIDREMIPVLEKLLFVLALPVMLFVGWPYLQHAWLELRSRRLSMDGLIALGSFAAFGVSTSHVFAGNPGVYFDTATMTIVLVTAGRYLEAHAKTRTSTAVRQLMSLQPDTARRVEPDGDHLVPAADVGFRELIRILPGERIPLDGVIVEGSTTINESNLTGESLPARRTPGQGVLAATVNIDGVIIVRVTSVSRETAHARIVRLMEDARRSRSPMQQLADRISTLFIPSVILLAVLTFAGWFFVAGAETALLHALTVLVVSCPCALGLGTPLATAIALGRTADEGVFVRSAALLEKLADTRHVVFDKTGTLTNGELRLWEVRTERSEPNFLSIVTALEGSSEHPVGKAIAEHARREGIQQPRARNVSALPGFGIKGEVMMDGDWTMVEVGSAELFREERDSTPPGPLDEQPATVVYAGWNGKLQGSMVFNDSLRKNAKDVVQHLQRLGISTSLLSGDSKTITQSIADAVGIRQAYGKLLPQDKLEMVHRLRAEGTTVMIGDGINDAPALAAADVGVTLGSATDIARESADVTILGDHLEKIPWLVLFARRTLRTIRWNLFWAFGYNAIGIALAVAGLLQPIIAAAAMVVSSLFIVATSRRI